MTSKAVAVAAITMTLVAPAAAAEPRAQLKFAEAPAQSGAPPQIDPHPSLAEEAPHIVPVLQPPSTPPPPAAQTSPNSASGLPEEAPHIVPVTPEAPGTAPTKVPAE